MPVMGLSTQQKNVLGDVLAWLSRPEKQYLTLGGYAGTGKTTITAALRLLLAKQRPQWNVAFAAYTGKATQVLAEKLKRLPRAFPQDSISTLHALLYQPITQSGGDIAGWRRKDELPYDLLVIDEASMVTGEMWKDILRFGIPILAVGDHGQLPPIGDGFNLMQEPDLVLTEIHRQAETSPIIQVATLARTTGEIPVEHFGPKVEKFDRAGSDAQLLLDEFFQSYQPYQDLFLVGFNTSRVAINHSVRYAKARYGEHPEAGDMVICLRNNWQKGIYNGQMGELLYAKPIRNEAELLSYDVAVVDQLGGEIYQGKASAAQFGAEGTIDLSKRERERLGEQFDFGYALTVHKAQGSQAPRVVVIEERSRHTSDEDWARWLYTAVTRAEKELLIFG